MRHASRRVVNTHGHGLSIEAQETPLRSLRDWLEAEDHLRPLAVRWVGREARPDEMGVSADRAMVEIDAQRVDDPVGIIRLITSLFPPA